MFDSRTELTQELDDSDQTKKTVHAPQLTMPIHEVVQRNHGQQVENEHSSEVLERHDAAFGVPDSVVVDVDDKKRDNDVGDHEAIARVGQRPQPNPDRVERYHKHRQAAVEQNGQQNDGLPDVVLLPAHRHNRTICRRHDGTAGE